MGPMKIVNAIVHRILDSNACLNKSVLHLGNEDIVASKRLRQADGLS